MKKLVFLVFVVILSVFAIQAQTSNNAASNSTKTEIKEKKKVFRATKDQITQAQKILKEKAKYAGAEDGKYNADLRTSVKIFQGENGLRQSGSLNRATLEKMNIALTDTQKGIPVNPNDLSSGDEKSTDTKRTPIFRATKDQVTEVQTKLKTGGLYSGEATGKLDDATREAIVARYTTS